jgi:high-affinity nickel permease
LEVVTFSFLAILFGVRHGMDADHIAAIADMKAKYKKTLFFILGAVTGMYSLGLGITIIYGV